MKNSREYYFLSPTHLQDLTTRHNWNYNKIIDELRQDVIKYDIDITDGDLEGILMGFFLQHNKESKLYENKGEGNNMNTNKKPITEALENLDENYVLKIKEPEDNYIEFDMFILEDDRILAHGSTNRNTMYPLDEALFELASERNLIPKDYGDLAEARGDLELLEELLEGDGLVITTLAGYSQGDHYTIITEGTVDEEFYTSVIFGGNFYDAYLLRIGRGKLIEEDVRGGFYIPEPNLEDLDDIITSFDITPAYYIIDSNIYNKLDFKDVLDSMGLKDFDELED